MKLLFLHATTLDYLLHSTTIPSLRKRLLLLLLLSPSSASLRLSCSKVPSSRTTKHIPIPVLPPELSEFSWTGKGYLDGSCYRPTDCVERGSLATVLTTFSRSTCISSLSRCDSSHHGLVPTFTSQSCPLRRTS